MAISASKRWGRRVGAAIVWAALAYGATLLQPKLNLDAELLKVVILKSGEIVLVLILGLSATDYIKIKGGNNAERQSCVRREG